MKKKKKKLTTALQHSCFETGGHCHWERKRNEVLVSERRDATLSFF